MYNKSILVVAVAALLTCGVFGFESHVFAHPSGSPHSHTAGQRPAMLPGTGGEDLLAKYQNMEVEPKKLELAKQLLEVTEAEAMMTNMLDRMMAMMSQQMPMVPREMWEGLMATADTKPVLSAMTNLYATTYSEKEMKGAIEFFTSEAGKGFLSKQEVVMTDAMQLGQQWGQQWAMKATQDAVKKMQAQEAVESEAPKSE